MDAKPCLVQTDQKQREIVNHGTPMFPCAGFHYEVGGDIIDCISWHWHEEAEVILAVKGSLKVEVPGHSIVLKEGEAIFINSNVLHFAVNTDESSCEIKSFVFDPQLIFGSMESAIEQKYVRPLVNCPTLSFYYFQNDLKWHEDAATCIEEAFSHFRKKSFGYELLVRNALSRLWFLLVSHLERELERHQNSKNTEAVRVKEMLTFIHNNYAESISLKNIAGSAAVSERECLRCFNKVLGITPMRYLLNHRISVAAGLLSDSDLHITEICKRSGFDSPSYFTSKFKTLFDTTPSAYRRRAKSLGLS